MARRMAQATKVSPSPNWSFRTVMLQVQQQSLPGSSTNGTFVPADKLSIAPATERLDRSSNAQTYGAEFNERYMSSEEALSPATQDDDEFSDSDSSYVQETPIKLAVCDMAVAVCFVSVGKAKVVRVPVPSQPSSRSPSLSSCSQAERPAPGFSTQSPSLPSWQTKPGLHTRLRDMKAASCDNLLNISPRLTSQTVSSTAGRASQKTHPMTKPSFGRFYTLTPTESATSREPSFLSQDPFAKPSAVKHQSRLQNLSQKLTRLGRSNSTASLKHQAQRDSMSPQYSPDSTPQKSSLSVSTIRRRSIRTMNQLLKPTALELSTKEIMVPRGASERVPTIEVPPCPRDFDKDKNNDHDYLNKRARFMRRKSLMSLYH